MNVIAVDVGTTSVRLALIAFGGAKFTKVKILASHEKDVSYQQSGVKFEQSSSELWQAICVCSKVCLKVSGIQPTEINGIAFSATCSLVVFNKDCDTKNDVIMWMDHRAINEALTITASESKVLDQFGGVCSPEFSLSKLMWLQKNEPNRIESASGLFELPDWLVHQCIRGSVQASPRSLCCVTCKWGYDADRGQHCEPIESLGLSSKLGQEILKPGTASGFLCREAANELGIFSAPGDKENIQGLPRIIVGTSLIDAHSGMLAMLSTPLDKFGLRLSIDSTFCSLAGTSTCHMILSKHRRFTRGIWGPYKDVVLDKYYLLEAGQSMTGKLIDMCIDSHHEGKQLLKEGRTTREIIKSLNEQIASCESVGQSELHVLPSFHGNRSPLANPRLKGGVYGLTAERQPELIDYYIATVESTVYETKLIVETLKMKLDTMLVSGGLMKNSFYMQTLADVLGCQVVKMALADVDFMVMGSGLVARQAVLNGLELNKFGSFGVALNETDLQGLDYIQLNSEIFEPRRNTSPYHDKKYSCYLQFVEFSQRTDEILNRS